MTPTLIPIRGPADYDLIVPGSKVALRDWVFGGKVNHCYEIISVLENDRVEYKWCYSDTFSKSGLAYKKDFRGYVIAQTEYEYVPTQEGDRDDDI